MQHEDTLVTIAADGTAILSTHVEVVLTYFGTCEVRSDMRWIVFLMITSPAAAEHWSLRF